ncbi:hypothetical protein EDC94DRAFT_677317 [Helicostylum pulchrum]|nr:hypothetical protein EDC94DRAFT_677317 [Helicostylum pulchrum]
MPPKTKLTPKIYFKTHCTSFDLVKFYEIYGTDDRKQSEEQFKSTIIVCKNTKGKENFKEVANDIFDKKFIILNTRPVNSYWNKIQNQVDTRVLKEALTEENIASSSLKKQTASQVIEELNKSESDSDYVDDDSDGESIEYSIDYLTGPGVTDYDLSITERPEFTSFIINNINISKRFLRYRDSIVRKAKDMKPLSFDERLVLNFIMVINENKAKPPYLLDSEWDSVIKSLESEYGTNLFDHALLNQLCSFTFERKKSRREDIINTFEDSAIKKILTVFNEYYGNTFSVNNLDEDSFMQFTLEPLLNVIFKNEGSVVIDGSSSTLDTNSKTRKKFDPTFQGKKADYVVSVLVEGSKKSLLINETKSMKSNVKSTCGDDSKLFNLMKNSVDDLQEYTLGNRTLGIHLEGYILA